MSKKHRRISSCPTGPMSDEEATRKLKLLSVTHPLMLDYNTIYDEEHSADSHNNLPSREQLQSNLDFDDNFSDISEAVSYRNIIISDDEKLRRELSNSVSTHQDEPTFSSYEYQGYKAPPSPTFDLELNEPRNPFPRFGRRSKCKILCITIIIILAIVIPIYVMRKSETPNSSIIVKSDHTEVYDLYWNSDGNSNNIFYNNYTLGYRVFKDPCIIVNDLTLIKTIINSNVPCVGKWCMNGKFDCNLDSDCYELTYVIPIENSGFVTPCKNITGNLVFVWRKWNIELQELNTLQRNTEISTVFGLDILSYVRSLIINCNLSSRC
jgi:hypothetical protein